MSYLDTNSRLQREQWYFREKFPRDGRAGLANQNAVFCPQLSPLHQLWWPLHTHTCSKGQRIPSLRKAAMIPTTVQLYHDCTGHILPSAIQVTSDIFTHTVHLFWLFHSCGHCSDKETATRACARVTQAPAVCWANILLIRRHPSLLIHAPGSCWGWSHSSYFLLWHREAHLCHQNFSSLPSPGMTSFAVLVCLFHLKAEWQCCFTSDEHYKAELRFAFLNWLLVTDNVPFNSYTLHACFWRDTTPNALYNSEKATQTFYIFAGIQLPFFHVFVRSWNVLLKRTLDLLNSQESLTIISSRSCSSLKAKSCIW